MNNYNKKNLNLVLGLANSCLFEKKNDKSHLGRRTFNWKTNDYKIDLKAICQAFLDEWLMLEGLTHWVACQPWDIIWECIGKQIEKKKKSGEESSKQHFSMTSASVSLWVPDLT